MKIKSHLIVGFYFLLVVLAYLRIYFGVGHTDEIQHIGSSVLRSLGGVPFVNESFIQQIASLFLSPLTELYVWVRGSFNGIILFFRHLYFLFYLFLSLFFIYTFKQIFKEHINSIILSALCFLTLTYAATFSLSYNTLGTGFLAIAFLFYIMSGQPLSLNFRGVSLYAVFSGASFVLAMASYPTLILTTLFYFLLILLNNFLQKNWQTEFKRVITVLGSALVTGLFLIIWLSTFDYDTIIDTIEFSKLFNIGGSFEEKKWFLFYHLNFYNQGWLPALGVLIVGLMFYKKVPIIISLLAFALTLSIYNWSIIERPFSQGLISILSVFGFFALLKWRRQNQTQKEIFYFGLALLLSMPFIAWASSATVTALPVVTQILGALVFLALMTQAPKKGALVFGVTLQIVFMVFQYSGYVSDFPITPAIARVESGPAAGLFTFQKRKEFFEQIEKDLSGLNQLGKTIFFEHYALGYLQSNLSIRSRVLLIHGLEKTGVLQAHYNYFKKAGPPDIFFELHHYPSWPPDVIDDLTKDLRYQGSLVLRKIFFSMQNYRAHINNNYYTIWVKN